MQEVAVHDSSERGWPPSRYRAAGTGFVVRALTGVHLREARYDESLAAQTWISDLRRGVLLRRETRFAEVMAASVEWVHVGPDGGLARAPTALLDAFQAVADDGPGARLPAATPHDPRPVPDFGLTPWWTEMDPLGHTNHPRYVDWFDEAISRALAARGVDPLGLVPVAEHLRYLASARAGDPLVVTGAQVGRVGDAAAFALKVVRLREDGARPDTLCDATLVRAHLDGAKVWA